MVGSCSGCSQSHATLQEGVKNLPGARCDIIIITIIIIGIIIIIVIIMVIISIINILLLLLSLLL